MRISTTKQGFVFPPEEYEIKYKQLINGLECSLSQTYYASTKSAHKKIERSFRKNNPNAYLIRIIYI